MVPHHPRRHYPCGIHLGADGCFGQRVRPVHAPLPMAEKNKNLISFLCFYMCIIFLGFLSFFFHTHASIVHFFYFAHSESLFARFLSSQLSDSPRACLFLPIHEIHPTLMFAAPPRRVYPLEVNEELPPPCKVIPPHTSVTLHHIDDMDDVEIETLLDQRNPEIMIISDDEDELIIGNDECVESMSTEDDTKVEDDPRYTSYTLRCIRF